MNNHIQSLENAGYIPPIQKFSHADQIVAEIVAETTQADQKAADQKAAALQAKQQSAKLVQDYEINAAHTLELAAEVSAASAERAAKRPKNKWEQQTDQNIADLQTKLAEAHKKQKQ